MHAHPGSRADEKDLVGLVHPRAEYWSKVSQEAKDFISSLVKADPSARPTASEALQHKWLTDHEPEDHDIGHGIRENWNPTRRWKSTINGLIATQRLAKGGRERARSRGESSGDQDMVPAGAGEKVLQDRAVDGHEGPRASEESGKSGYKTAEEEDGGVEEATKGVERL